MAKNDKVLLDGIIDDRIEIKLPSSRRDEAFEYLAFEQILKDADLSRDEIVSGSVDGRNDGGIDGFFILVNGHLLTDPEAFAWPRTGSQLEVWIITCKHHDTFKQAPLDNLVASLSELLDFGLDADQLKGDYSDQILKCRENLKFAYRKLSSKMSTFTINFSYASRGETTDIGESIVSRSEQIKSIAKESFGACESNFYFHGCTELVELHRRMPNFSLELPFFEALSRGERYVVLTSLKDYYNFISDNGKLRRYLFDSNVRDFMGLNRVNEDIKATLEDNESPDFWWLNNGVTILATSASVIGKSIQLQDIQIVNGLQTTESIYRYFESGGNDNKERSVLVKIIVSGEETIRDSIIRATNNQTNVELSSLHATDKIQRDIEDVLVRSGLYYERRKNYYLNLGHSTFDIITPLYLAAGYVNLVLKSPSKATSLRSRFMRSDEAYDLVFSPKTPIEVWPKIAASLKKTDEVLEKLRPTQKTANDKFLKKWRQITCFLTVSKIIGKYDFNANELIQFDLEKLTDGELESTWKFLREFDPMILSCNISEKRSLVASLCEAFSKLHTISGIERIEKLYGAIDKKPVKQVKVNMEFALKVNALLPPQPWKPMIHKEITKQLKCDTNQYFAAVKLLIEEGIRNRQKDGVVYDTEGNVITFDPERVDPDSLELLPQDA